MTPIVGNTIRCNWVDNGSAVTYQIIKASDSSVVSSVLNTSTTQYDIPLAQTNLDSLYKWKLKIYSNGQYFKIKQKRKLNLRF